ncbi:MAG: DUF460 domain-containing protein, partial [Candidatus Nanohaloarchaea archaeon]|nr:DUF460 domain-containing protein [Candidatus Nanohaloarchaea archaeon]
MRSETDLRIVGIDPGTTSGVALLDLGGELVDYTSRKEFSKDRIIEFMVENGKPLVLATDVSPAPSLVEEIASNTGSKLVVPEEDLESGYKEELVSDFGVEEKDSHVKDALAAAEYSRREYSDKMEEIERRVEVEGVEEKLEDVIELVVRGSLSISEAVSEVKKVSGPEEEGGGEPREEERDWEAIADRRKQRIDILETKVENLEEHLEEGEDQGHEEPVAEELRRRNQLIKELKGEIDRT